MFKLKSRTQRKFVSEKKNSYPHNDMENDGFKWRWCRNRPFKTLKLVNTSFIFSCLELIEE